MRQIFTLILVFVTAVAVAQTPNITIGALKDSIYCPNSGGVNIAYSTTGTFAADNQFIFKITNKATNASYQLNSFINNNTTGRLVSWNLPETMSAGDYQVEVFATNPFVTSNISPTKLRIIDRTPQVTVTNTPVTINRGESTPLTFKLTQKYPFDVVTQFITHNDDTGRFTEITLPAGTDSLLYNVSPLHTTFYNGGFWVSVGGCGTGTGTSNALVMTNEPLQISGTPAPFFGNFCGGYKGEFTAGLQLRMQLEGTFTPDTKFSILLSDSTGLSNYQPITTFGVSSQSINGYIPAPFPSGQKYTAKIVTKNPDYVSDVIGPFGVIRPPTVKISGSQTITKGDSATLQLDFTGNGPWKFGVVSNSNGNSVSSKAIITYKNPHYFKVAPTNPTAYRIDALSFWNSCGADSAEFTQSGMAFVDIAKIPTLADTMIDLSTKILAYPKSPNVGDTVYYRIMVANYGRKLASAILTKIALPKMVKFLSYETLGRQKFVSAVPQNDTLWQFYSLAANDSTVIIIKTKVIEKGLGIAETEIVAAEQPDLDSTPNNGNEFEDDFGRSCISVPITICKGELLELQVPSKYENPQWIRDGAIISNLRTIRIGTPGDYSFQATNFLASQDFCSLTVLMGECCPKNVCIPTITTRTRVTEK